MTAAPADGGGAAERVLEAAGFKPDQAREIAARIRERVAALPPPTVEQRAQLRALLDMSQEVPAVAPPDPWDAALSAIRSAVDDLGAWLAIWSARHEPDAHARRCASDAVGAIDAALTELHGIRARLISETRQADDAAAARVDVLLGTGRATRPGLRRRPVCEHEPPPRNPASARPRRSVLEPSA